MRACRFIIARFQPDFRTGLESRPKTPRPVLPAFCPKRRQKESEKAINKQ